MANDPQKQLHRRKDISLPEYDYTQPGAYFVTMVTEKRRHLFGQVREGAMRLNAFGQVVEGCWREIPAHVPGVSNAIFVVMPNHFHGIIEINEVIRDVEKPGVAGGAGAPYMAPQPDRESIEDKLISLGTIIGTFKAAVSRKIHRLPGGEGIKVWQRNYFENIIRDEGEYERIADYIQANPENWEADR